MNQQQSTVIIKVSPQGEISIEVDGIKGSDCTALTQPLEDQLGVVQDRKLKPEYKLRKVANQNQNQVRS